MGVKCVRSELHDSQVWDTLGRNFKSFTLNTGKWHNVQRQWFLSSLPFKGAPKMITIYIKPLPRRFLSWPLPVSCFLFSHVSCFRGCSPCRISPLYFLAGFRSGLGSPGGHGRWFLWWLLQYKFGLRPWGHHGYSHRRGRLRWGFADLTKIYILNFWNIYVHINSDVCVCVRVCFCEEDNIEIILYSVCLTAFIIWVSNMPVSISFVDENLH